MNHDDEKLAALEESIDGMEPGHRLLFATVLIESVSEDIQDVPMLNDSFEKTLTNLLVTQLGFLAFEASPEAFREKAEAKLAEREDADSDADDADVAFY